MHKPDVECSLCHYIVHGNADQYDLRKKRHADKHSPHITLSERDGHAISRNNIIGKVRWITVWS